MESGDETVIVFSPTIAMDKMDTIVRGRGDVDAGGDTGAVDRDDSGLEFKYTPQQMRIIKDPIHDFSECHAGLDNEGRNAESPPLLSPSPRRFFF